MPAASQARFLTQSVRRHRPVANAQDTCIVVMLCERHSSQRNPLT